MRTSLTISSAAHAGLLVLGLVSFGTKPFDAQPTESLPIDIISADQFSQLTKGQKNAPKVETAKPLAEKIGEAKPVDTVAKASEKKEINTASDQPPPVPQSKPEPAPTDAKKELQPKVDTIAEALKKEEAKKTPKPETKPTPAPKPVQQQPKFDPKQIAALLDKRDPRRQVASAEAVSSTPSLGTTTGRAATLSLNEIEALKKRIGECWNVPPGAQDLKVVIRVAFNPDGSVAGTPELLVAPMSPSGPAFYESAKRAVLGCQPYKMLRLETYDVWKDIEMTFDPKEFMR